MSPFQLLTPTPCMLAGVTLRTEKHGEDSVPAVSLSIKITASNTLLDELQPGLMAMLYEAPEQPEEEPELDGLEHTMLPALRSRLIERLVLRSEFVGWHVNLEYGIDEASAIDLAGCKVDKFRVEPHEGGSISLFMRVSTNNIDEIAMGRLSMMNGTEMQLKLVAPAIGADAIDGTQGAFDADHGGGDLFNDGVESSEPRRAGPAEKAAVNAPVKTVHKPSAAEALADAEAAFKPSELAAGTESGAIAWPFDESARAPAPLVSIEQSQPGTRTARGRDATKAFLAANDPAVKLAVKYRNEHTGESWSGRGLQPAWLKAALANGSLISDFDVSVQA